MELTNKARVDSNLNETDGVAARLLRPDFVEAYRAQVLGRPAASRGTTHVSIIDAQGNAASLSLTNGEGSAYIVPGTEIMLNNMLGRGGPQPTGIPPLVRRPASLFDADADLDRARRRAP